jgi:hypothetical protein
MCFLSAILTLSQICVRTNGAPACEDSVLSVNCESRKTKLSVLGFGDYRLLKKDRELASKLQITLRSCIG